MDPFARNMLRSTLAFAIALLVIFAAMTVAYIHVHPPCPDTVLGQSAGTAGRFTAAVLQRRCGEDAPFISQVSLRASSEGLQRGFFSGQVNQGIVFRVEQDAAGAGLAVNWTGPEELTIRCPRCEQAFIQQHDKSWGAVRIVYQASNAK